MYPNYSAICYFKITLCHDLADAFRLIKPYSGKKR